MSAGMAAKVQTKTHFLGSTMDLNNGSCNGMWDAYHDDRNRGYNSFLMSQTMDGTTGYLKEQMRLTILKQESVFRHQLQELHRLYKRQKDLMNEHALGAANSSHFSSQFSAQISKKMHTQGKVIDLELPADAYDDDDDGHQYQSVNNVHNLSTKSKRAYNFADLNEPVHVEEASFAASVSNKNRRVFGVELFECSHKTSFDSSRDQNNHERWIEPCEKGVVFDGQKRHENLEKQLPHWLLKPKGKETTVYQMNLDSLQQNSQQFFKKAEKLQTDHFHGITKILGVPVIDLTNDKNAKNDNSKHFVESRPEIDLNLSFDEEEDPSPTPNIPEPVVKTTAMQIDLEAPAALEAVPDDVSMDANDQEMVKFAAEAIISISSSEPPPADSLLLWLAEVITLSSDGFKDSANVNKNDDYIPEGMDDFEYMTLKLQETKEDQPCYEPVIVAEKEEDDNVLRKRAARKGQGKRGRPRKDFQRDVLPGIISLSRREVSEDLQTFEEALNAIGISWQSKRKSVGKNGRGRPRLVVTSPPSPPSPPTAAEKSVSQKVALDEKSLSGWGKRTRRLPRRRYQNGANNHSLALKC